MITGIVNRDEAVILLQVRGRNRQTRQIEAVVDTGFTAWLTLPPALVAGLELRWHSFGRGTLADGSETFFDIYEAAVVWDGRVRRIRVQVFDADPLVGMALLRGCELKMHVRSRGGVVIKRLPGWRSRRTGE
jgi:clan AA aspartic protease